MAARIAAIECAAVNTNLEENAVYLPPGGGQFRSASMLAHAWVSHSNAWTAMAGSTEM
jgi:hypothetical protein